LTGRWLSRDPLAENGGVNLYAFCNNDPVNGVDGLGLDTEEKAQSRWHAAWGDYKDYAKTSTSVVAAISLASIAIPDPSDAVIQPIAWGGQAINLVAAGVAITTVTAGHAIYDWAKTRSQANAYSNDRTPVVPPARIGVSAPANPPPDPNEPKRPQKASEKTAKDMARQIEKDLGKPARREFHDFKKGADRTLQELKDDVRAIYEGTGKVPPRWMQ
jgi:hypothetical protein